MRLRQWSAPMRRIKKLTLIMTHLITYIVVLFCTASQVSAASGGKSPDGLTVGVPSDRCPIFYQDGDTGEIVGIGIGYSSLNMLKEVQVDRIKLDMRFLTETGDSEKGRVIINHVIGMAGSLGMELMAEGVEKEDQARFLKEQGCLDMQGFYFYKPMPSPDFEKLISCLD
ncbi:MAG: EAL domain-containing protein [Lachnospiraceae bacterium]|nr:EAL domain-containing protein [Lachnospiraceae bacterium]